MSRHRAVRDMAKSRDYEDEMDEPEDDEFGTSPASPSASQYLYNRGKGAAKPSGLSAFLSPPSSQQPKTPQRTSGFDWPKPVAPTPTPMPAHAKGAPPPGFADLPTPSVTGGVGAAERLAECLSAMHAVLGEAPTVAQAALVAAAERANYQPDRALALLLDAHDPASSAAIPAIGDVAPSPVVIKTPVKLVVPAGVPKTPAAAEAAGADGGEEVAAPASGPRAPSPVPRTRKLPKQHSAARRKEIEAKLAESKEEKARLNLVVIGHVDAGKSTLMGHLLYLLGHVSKRTMDKYERDSHKEGKGSFAFAWVLDAHAEERARGITMDVAVEHFETPHRTVTLLDAPGHRDFVPNMISGAAQADVAILVVNARTGEFEAGFEANGQTREHAVLARSLGVQQLIVAVNQLDAVGWDRARFDAIVARLVPFLRQSGFKEASVTFVPVSGFTGENLVKRAEPALSAWYTGPTLLERIDALAPPVRLVQRPLRLCVSDVYKGLNMGVVAVGGKLEAGLVAVNDTLLVLPAVELCTVKTVLSQQQAVAAAVAGDNVELGLQGLDPAMLGPGSVLCDPEAPVPVVKRFTAQVITFAPLAHPITQGMHVIVHVQNVNEAGFLSRLVAITDRNKGTVVKRRPKFLPEKTNAVVEITLHRPLCLELYSTFAQLGRFMLRDTGRTIAAGIVTELNEQVRIA